MQVSTLKLQQTGKRLIAGCMEMFGGLTAFQADTPEFKRKVGDDELVRLLEVMSDFVADLDKVVDFNLLRLFDSVRAHVTAEQRVAASGRAHNAFCQLARFSRGAHEIVESLREIASCSAAPRLNRRMAEVTAELLLELFESIAEDCGAPRIGVVPRTWDGSLAQLDETWFQEGKH